MSKTAVITGAAGGIGRDLCAGFSAADYEVIAVDRQANPGVQCSSYLNVDLVRAFEDPAGIDKIATTLRDCFGGNGLDVLINNAAHQVVKETRLLTHTDWSTSIATNLSVPFQMIQSMLPDLESTAGCVINIASIHARLTKPGFVAYATSKAGLVGLTNALAIDLGERVRVNAISPAAIDTPMLRASFSSEPDMFMSLAEMHPIGRIGNTSDVVSTALFLASEKASFITGANFTLDGGISSRLFDPI